MNPGRIDNQGRDSLPAISAVQHCRAERRRRRLWVYRYDRHPPPGYAPCRVNLLCETCDGHPEMLTGYAKNTLHLLCGWSVFTALDPNARQAYRPKRVRSRAQDKA